MRPLTRIRRSRESDDGFSRLVELQLRVYRKTGRAVHLAQAARALVDWSREDLAEKSSIGAGTIKDFERNGTDPKMGTVQKLIRARSAGVEFLPETGSSGPGVRLKKREAKKR